jgi:hypothetical protein
LFDKGQKALIQYPSDKAGASYTIPNTGTIIGDSAFYRCFSLTSVTIPDSVTSIGVEAFVYCTNLTSVTISNGVTTIGGGAFDSCTSLTSVTIPNSVTSIGDYAFDSCTSLTNVTIGNAVTSIGDGAFSGCFSLTAITVDSANQNYSSIAGVLFDKGQKTLIKYPQGKVGSYTIPNTVTSIGDNAFYRCFRLTSVTIPGSVTNIGDSAFSWCYTLVLGLGKVYFEGNAPAVWADSFSVSPPLGGRWIFDPATVYFLPGTTGWSNNFAGLPTAIWTPEVQTADASFGAKSNQFGFNVNWASGMSVVVEASPSLSNPVWSPVATNTLSGGTFHFSDPQWTKYPSRFYRVRSQ